jgi:hypothetical protein
MHYRTIMAAALAAAGLAFSGVACAQTATSSTTTDSWRMPYQSGFWGHAGVSAGRGELDASCVGAGLACDKKDTAFRAYAGGRFNNAIGLEIGALNIGDYERGGGKTDGWGMDVALIAGVPIGANSSVFGKLGTAYTRTDVTGSPAGIAAGLRTGEESGWGPRWGVGAQVGLTPQWALRLDWDRFQVQLPAGDEDLDTLMLGLQYTFR